MLNIEHMSSQDTKFSSWLIFMEYARQNGCKTPSLSVILNSFKRYPYILPILSETHNCYVFTCDMKYDHEILSIYGKPL